MPRVTKSTPKSKAPAKAVPVREPTPEPVVEAEVAETGTKKDTRYFKVVGEVVPQNGSSAVATDALSNGGGRYSGNNPKQAATKAFTAICRAAGARETGCSYSFTIQETTRDSAKKTYSYIGVRTLLENPTVVKKGDTSFTIRFKNTVTANRVRPSVPEVIAAPEETPVEEIQTPIPVEEAVEEEPTPKAPRKRVARRTKA